MPTVREHPLTYRDRSPRARRAREFVWEIPIFDQNGGLVGWTSQRPEYSGSRLYHSDAERLVGGSVVTKYVQISDPTYAKRAGAPPGWKDPWRCLALCAEKP